VMDREPEQEPIAITDSSGAPAGSVPVAGNLRLVTPMKYPWGNLPLVTPKVRVEGIFLPVMSCMVESDEGYFASIKARYVQARRHMQGINELSYACLRYLSAIREYGLYNIPLGFHRRFFGICTTMLCAHHIGLLFLYAAILANAGFAREMLKSWRAHQSFDAAQVMDCPQMDAEIFAEARWERVASWASCTMLSLAPNCLLWPGHMNFLGVSIMLMYFISGNDGNRAKVGEEDMEFGEKKMYHQKQRKNWNKKLDSPSNKFQQYRSEASGIWKSSLAGGLTRFGEKPCSFLTWKIGVTMRTWFEVYCLNALGWWLLYMIIPEALAVIQLSLKGQSFKYVVAEKKAVNSEKVLSGGSQFGAAKLAEHGPRLRGGHDDVEAAFECSNEPQQPFNTKFDHHNHHRHHHHHHRHDHARRHYD